MSELSDILVDAIGMTEGARGMASQALDKDVHDGDANVASALKKAVKNFETVLLNTTATKWKVKAGNDLFSMSSGRNNIDIYWDWDPVRGGADMFVEGPGRFTSHTFLSMRGISDMSRPGRSGEGAVLGLIMDAVAKKMESLDEMIALRTESVGMPQDARNKLVAALSKTKLDTSSGQRRTVSPDEFMLMNPRPTDNGWEFKHTFTRNYIFIDSKTGKVVVQKTGKPFYRGMFDSDGFDPKVLGNVNRHVVDKAMTDLLAKLGLGTSPETVKALSATINKQLSRLK